MASTAEGYNLANSFLGLGAESAYADGAARTVWLEINSCSFKHVCEQDILDHLRVGAASYNARASFYTRREYWMGTVELPVTYDNFGILWRQAIASGTTTTDSPTSGFNTHLFKRALAFPVGLACEVDRGAASKELFKGGKIKAFTLTGEAGGYLRAAFDFIGSYDSDSETEPRSDTAASATFGTDSNKVFMDHGGPIGWDSDTWEVKNFTLRVENGLDFRYFVGSRTTQEPARRARELITFEADVEVDDKLFKKYIQHTQGDLTFPFDHPGSVRALNLAVHNAQIDTEDSVIPNTVDIGNQRLRWRAFSDGTDEGLALTSVNAETLIANG